MLRLSYFTLNMYENNPKKIIKFLNIMELGELWLNWFDV